ncbi:MAG: SGNH/GDSL hydrolase family protein, partial [Deltaproteobacteria bacterium]|nr:SGNH/GDSL hydrolase family protein [Deltaproteobacteria bacterium]
MSTESNSSSDKSGRVPLWQAIFLPVAAILVFFLLLEGGLALLGVKPTLKTEDPFVGFASNVPLFVPGPGPMGKNYLTTAQNKLNNFNQQSFPQEKAPNTFRIFSLGGSTTYGRPYNDLTSFSNWLRELLPVADRSKNWEVINAGGISYASYRSAYLMEELINYQPDLFIVYTGHNEFLEERTYGQIRDMSPIIRTTVSVLARTRTWSAMTTAFQKLGIHPEEDEEERDNLALEVVTILDKSAGLERYTRDDPLQEKILRHYRISLERMVAMARSVGAKIIFVTPAGSLNDCTPFKSEHTKGLDSAAVQRSEQVL